MRVFDALSFCFTSSMTVVMGRSVLVGSKCVGLIAVKVFILGAQSRGIGILIVQLNRDASRLYFNIDTFGACFREL